MGDPNDQLRQVRERLPSRQTPGESLSRQELAELVNTWIYQHKDWLVELDANYIGKLERGIIRWPSRLYRQAFRAVLGVEADSQLGFWGHRRPDIAEQAAYRLACLRGEHGSRPWGWMGVP